MNELGNITALEIEIIKKMRESEESRKLVETFLSGSTENKESS